MDKVAIVLGYIVLAGLAFCVGYLVVHFAFSVARSVSFHRFMFAAAKKNGRKLKWRKFPKSFLGNVWRNFWEGPATRIFGPGGEWRGVGDWRTWKVPQKPEESEDIK